MHEILECNNNRSAEVGQIAIDVAWIIIKLISSLTRFLYARTPVQANTANCKSQNHHLTVFRAFSSRGYVTLLQEFQNVKVDTANQQSVKAIGCSTLFNLKFVSKISESRNFVVAGTSCTLTLYSRYRASSTNIIAILFQLASQIVSVYCVIYFEIK